MAKHKVVSKVKNTPQNRYLSAVTAANKATKAYQAAVIAKEEARQDYDAAAQFEREQYSESFRPRARSNSRPGVSLSANRR